MDKIKKNSGVKKIIDTWNENPMLVIGVAATAMMGAAKLIDAISSARSRHAYAKQVDYRVGGRRRPSYSEYQKQGRRR